MSTEDHLPDRWEISAPEGGLFVFNSAQEAADYAKQEFEKWSWLAKHKTAVYGRKVWEAVSVLSTLQSKVASPRESTFASDVQSLLAKYLQFLPALHNRAPLQSYIQKIGSQRQKHGEAYATLGWVAKLEGATPDFGSETLETADYIAGLANAQQFLGLSTSEQRAEDILNSLNALYRSGEELRKTAFEDAEAAQRARAAAEEGALSITKRRESVEHQLAEALERIEEAVSASVESAEQTIHSKLSGIENNLKDDWRRLTNTYEALLSLEAPATYWKSKSKEHREWALRFAQLSGATAIVGGLILGRVVFLVFGELVITKMPSWSQVLSVTLGVVLYLWTLRTLIRLTMSHVHLALDSEERRTMILSYVAISRKLDVTAEERKALFAAIFRPTGDGIVKDESPPLLFLEALKGGGK